MNKFERWILKRIVRKEVKQGYKHNIRIGHLYSAIRAACEEEFVEDSPAALDVSLREWFEATQYFPKTPKSTTIIYDN